MALIENAEAPTGTLTAAAARRMNDFIPEEELSDVYNRYIAGFLAPAVNEDTDEDGSLQDLQVSIDLHKALAGTSDIGVEEDCRKSVQELFEVLGLKDKKSLPWLSRCRNRLPVSVWAAGMTAQSITQELERAHKHLDDTGAPLPGWVLLDLHWHQLVGIVSILRKFFKDQDPSGVLVADEVGLGKTAQTLGVIAMFAHYQEQAKLELPFAGLARECQPFSMLLGSKAL